MTNTDVMRTAMAGGSAVKARLLLGAAALLLTPGQAWAQPAPTPVELAAAEVDESAIGEITVTARRREEDVQDVPIAITVATEADLQRQDLRTAGDLERSIPGLSICCGRGQASNPFLRGVPGVVGYFADVPAPLDGGSQYFDITSVQVLKGPQGTLFGLSTNGGAILYEPRAPEEEFGGRVATVVGSRDRLTLEGVLNAPMSQALLLRFAGQRQRVDGYITDVSTGRKLGGDDYFVLRGSALLRPADGIRSLTIVDYSKSEGRPYPAVVRAVDPAGLFRRVFGAARADAFLAQQQELGSYRVPGLAASDPRRDDEQLKIINRTSIDLSPELTLKNIAGYVEVRSFSYYDRAGTPFPLLTINAPPTARPEPVEQVSEELQLAGAALDRRLTFVLGGFYLKSTQDPTLVYNITLGARSGTRSGTRAETTALYAEGESDLSELVDGLSAVAGYRHSWDERRASQDRVNAAGATIASFAERAKWNEGSYRLGLRYALGGDASLYLTNSRGYSSGGFNLTAPESLRVYEPESLDNYEVGFKSDWRLGPVAGRFNVAAYYGRYKDIQVPVTSRVETPAGPQVAVVTQNAARGEIKGVEAEFTIVPAPPLQLSGNFSYMDARYTDYDGLDPTGAAVVDLSDTAFVYVPEWKYTLAGS